MKKFIMAIVCLMTMAMSANAQNMASLKQGAVNFIRGNCKAPSTFILTDKLGHRISPQSIKCEITKGYEVYDSVYEKDRTIDSLIICKHKLGIDPFYYRAYSMHSPEGIFITLYESEAKLSGKKIRHTKRAATHCSYYTDIDEERSKEIRVDSITFSNNYKYSLRDTLVYYNETKPIRKNYMKYTYNTTYTFYFYYEAQNSMGGLVQDFAEVNYDTKTKEYYTGKIQLGNKKIIKSKNIPIKKPKIIYSFLRGMEE